MKIIFFLYLSVGQHKECYSLISGYVVMNAGKPATTLLQDAVHCQAFMSVFKTALAERATYERRFLLG